MSIRSRVRRHRAEAPDLEITAFMNLMVILVPFLLITAVFSNLSVLELNLPDANDPTQQSNPEERNFEVIVRKDEIIVADTIGGVLKAFPVQNDEYPMKEVSDLLVSVKSRYPEKDNITILLEQNIEYDTVIHVMDTVRVKEVVEAGSVVQKELFPVIAIGDAPPPSETAKAANP
jgi:biopolymer transport protein ExbD